MKMTTDNTSVGCGDGGHEGGDEQDAHEVPGEKKTENKVITRIIYTN